MIPGRRTARCSPAPELEIKPRFAEAGALRTELDVDVDRPGRVDRATLVGMTRVVPRYCSRPLPRTGFVPGVSRRADRPPEPLPRPAVVDFDALARDDDFRYGIDLFNHALPWEAHEAWEPLWFAAPRDRPERALLQGLIHAAAAVVKAKAGALDTARGFVDSACSYLALAAALDPVVIDLAAFTAALAAWAADPAQPAPPILLASPDPAAP
jgi:hypothetical protein